MPPVKLIGLGRVSSTSNFLISPGLTPGKPYTLSCWYLFNSGNANSLIVREQGSSTLMLTVAPALAVPSPGATNGVATTLAPIPPVWLNEAQPDNVTGPTNSAGQRGPWIELYNAGANQVSLAGLGLANNYATPLQWLFPSDALLNPGEFRVVFCDGQTNLAITRSCQCHHATGRQRFGKANGAQVP